MLFANPTGKAICPAKIVIIVVIPVINGFWTSSVSSLSASFVETLLSNFIPGILIPLAHPRLACWHGSSGFLSPVEDYRDNVDFRRV
jgi:hypothetical protein